MMNDPLHGLSGKWPNKTATLSRVFDDTAASYKFFWFLGILTLMESGQKLIQDEVVAEMIVSAWSPVCFYRLSLGLQDKLQDAVKELQLLTTLQNDAKPEAVRKALVSEPALRKRIRSLGMLVPTRFLSPWFTQDLRGVQDDKRTKAIEQLSLQSQQSTNPCPYSFESEGGKTIIRVHPEWLSFLKENIQVLRGFISQHLCKYLQSRNPNTPGIVNKLITPRMRDLANAKHFWSQVRNEYSLFGNREHFSDIYSGEYLADSFSIDHFLPWSFVAHDLIWNLIPVSKSTNSKKGDNLPSIEHYFDRYAAMHRQAILSLSKKPKLLEDYTTCFKQSVPQLLSINEETFLRQYTDVYQPLFQIAKNQGFSPNWIFTN